MSKRLQDLATPLTQTRRAIEKYAARPFESLSAKQRFWLGFAVLCLLTTVFINNPFWRTTAEIYKEGDIARESVIAPADISITDEEETTRVRQSARETVQPIFTFEPKRADEVVQSFRSAWENLLRRKELADANANVKGNSNIRVETAENWTGAGGAEVGKVFAARKFSQNELDSVTRSFARKCRRFDLRRSGQTVFSNGNYSQRPPETESAISRQNAGKQYDRAFRIPRKICAKVCRQIRSLSEKEVAAFDAALAPLIQPSIIFDSAATENARQSIEKNVPPVTVSLKRGQTVVREGDTITPSVLSQIAAIRSYSDSTQAFESFFRFVAADFRFFWVGVEIYRASRQFVAHTCFRKKKHSRCSGLSC